MIARVRKVPLRSLPSYFDQAARTHSRDFTWFRVPGTTSESRISVLVPKSVAKHAVRRNSIKRMVYEELSRLPIWELGADIVIRAQRSATDVTPRRIHEQIKQIFYL